MLLLCLLLCVKGSFSTKSEIFSSADSIGRLANIEKNISQKIESYLGELNHQIEVLDSLLNEYYADYTLTDLEVDEYISNPINVYTLIKRTSHGWQSVKNVLHNETTEMAFQEIVKLLGQLPSTSDIEGAVHGLFLMQDVYDLDINALSEGILVVNGEKISDSGASLTATDLELIGRIAFNNQFFDRAYEWLICALKKARKSDESQDTISRIQSEIQTTIKYHDIVLELRGFPRGLTWKTYVTPLDPELASKKKYKKALKENGGTLSYKRKSKLIHPLKEYEVQDLFNALCRGEDLRDPDIEKELSCINLHFNDPFLRLGPFQFETINLKPNIVVFHNFLYENEMEILKTFAAPLLERSQHSGSRYASEISFTRTSKQVWLKEEDLSSNGSLKEMERAISQRIHLATKFELYGAGEDYQIANYGIGGVYKTHFDSFGEKEYETNVELSGDRLATTMAYLSDVEAGGSTVFPVLGVQIQPRKGSLLMWFNKDINGNTYTQSYHGGCPLLSGSKWILNKWIRAYDQWRNFPCSLNAEAYERISRPVDNNFCDDRCNP